MIFVIVRQTKQSRLVCLSPEAKSLQAAATNSVVHRRILLCNLRAPPAPLGTAHEPPRVRWTQPAPQTYKKHSHHKPHSTNLTRPQASASKGETGEKANASLSLSVNCLSAWELPPHSAVKASSETPRTYAGTHTRAGGREKTRVFLCFSYDDLRG